ncbi:MAG TPA: hypothetical protein DCP28_26060 [Cytophagales bacterium]|nr:hypothetical protein [Cytophagales bacterium]
MNLPAYLIGFTLCLTALWAFYHLCLAHEPFHHLKRIYLLSAIVVSAIIPQITFTAYVDTPATPISTQLENPQSLLTVESPPHPETTNSILPQIVSLIYLLGLGLFAIRFFHNLGATLQKINKNELHRVGKMRYVLLDERVVPNTFLWFIFLNKEQYRLQTIPQEVLHHEEVHARHLHAIDLIFIELVKVLLWFHPLVHLIRSAIKLNHEFLADQGVLANGSSRRTYQSILLEYATKGRAPSLSNAFNFSLIKRRFKMMTKSANKRVMFLKLGLVLPLLSLLLYSFSHREVVHNGAVYSAGNPDVSEAELIQNPAEEYNRLAKHYNTYPEADFLVKLRDMWKIRDLYTSIPKEERAALENYPRSTTSLTVFISDDGKYIVDEKEVTLSWVSSLLDNLNDRERSNVYVFDSMTDYKRYVSLRGQMNRSALPPNDVYISIFSERLVESTLSKGFEKAEGSIQEVNHADRNPEITTYLETLLETLESQRVNIDY